MLLVQPSGQQSRRMVGPPSPQPANPSKIRPDAQPLRTEMQLPLYPGLDLGSASPE